MARQMGVSLEEMKAALNAYIKVTPVDEDDWQGDVSPAWPYA